MYTIAGTKFCIDDFVYPSDTKFDDIELKNVFTDAFISLIFEFVKPPVLF